MVEVRGTYAGGGTLIHDGFTGREPAFEEAVAAGLDFIGKDAGSTDCGPFHLGAAQGLIPRAALKQHLTYLLSLSVSHNVPLLIGSANVAGTRAGVQRFREVVEEVAREQGLKFRAAFIDSELDKSYVAQALAEGRIQSLSLSPPLDHETVDQATRIVGMMGTEPYVNALDGGATVIVGGRTTDPALFAAVPIWKGIPLGIAWHMAKVLDHGQTNLEPEPGYVHFTPGAASWAVGVASEDHFRIESSNDRGRCTVVRAAHTTLYENQSSTAFPEPPGIIEIENCRFEQLDPRTVKVSGSKFIPQPYSIRIEGVEQVGFRAFTICGVRHPDVIANLDAYLRRVKDRIGQRAATHGISERSFELIFHVYGRGAVMGAWDPGITQVPDEVGILAECLAGSPELAEHVMTLVELQLHVIGGPDFGAAFPMSPQVMHGGAVYRFSILHKLEPEDPVEFCTTDMVDL